MRYYTVHAPPDDDPERFRFVKDGFSWPALFFPILFILWHRMWLTLVYYIVFVLVVAWIGRLGGDDAATTVAIIGSVLFALEANNLRRTQLDMRGFEEVGNAYGANLDEAEARFFGRFEESVAGASKSETIARAAFTPLSRAHGADEAIIGLFPEPER